MRRRTVLSQLLALGAVVAMPPRVRAAARNASPGPRFVAAWADEAGRQHLGVVSARGDTLTIVRSIEIPGRAHGLVVEPDGNVLAAARRPGDWVLRWSPASGAARWFACASDRHFTGHLLREPTGRWLYSAETDTDSGQGLIAVRDARSFELHAEWATQGIDPHQFILDADGSLLVANGGVPTRPETGRTKLDLAHMDPSLVRLDSRSGALLGQWRLTDPRLSIRHLSRDPIAAPGLVGIALQAEHDDAQAKAAAPVLAVFDGDSLRTLEAPLSLAGYGGDIVVNTAGFLVSAPRAGGVARWGRDGRWAGFTPLTEACSLASTGKGEVWVGGRTQAAECDDSDASDTIAAHAPGTVAPRHLAINSLRLDNHWVAL